MDELCGKIRNNFCFANEKILKIFNQNILESEELKPQRVVFEKQLQTMNSCA
jgi:hypothetical protein